MTQVFESPNGGETVYVREPGSSERRLYSQSEKIKSKRDKIKEVQLWHNIRQEAKTNLTLQKALEQCIIIYNLSKDNGSKT